MASNQKVVKLKRRRNINIGTIIFVILFIYIAINVSLYLTKDRLSIYEVHEGANIDDNIITGLIIRDEKLIYTNKAGYISYFQKEGARVAKDSAVYSVDDSKDYMDVIANGDLSMKITDEINAEMKHDINVFHKSFTNDDFTYVYRFKENVQNTAIDLLNSTLITQGQALSEETGLTYSYNMIPCDESGIITYYMDSFENVTADTVTSDMFQMEQYERKGLRSTEMITQNSPVYKIIKSEQWSILLPLNKAQYEALLDKEQITCKILKDDVKVKMKVNLISKGTEYYAELIMDKYMSNYLEDRYLDIEIDFGAIKGLKIPKTSVFDKDFYIVPKEYFTSGGNGTSDGLTVGSYSKNGEINYTYESVNVYYNDGTYGYVDANQFEIGTWVQSAQTSDRYQLTQMAKLTGVYNVNAGYAVFKRIEILDESEEYYIIDKNTSYGLSAYDHIALDAKLAVDQEIIY